MICLDCAFVSGIAEQAAAYVPQQPAERTTEIPVVREFADSGAAVAVVAGSWASVAPGRHRAAGPPGQIPHVPRHARTSWSHSNVGVDVPGSWYLPGTSTPGSEGIASAA